MTHLSPSSYPVRDHPHPTQIHTFEKTTNTSQEALERFPGSAQEAWKTSSPVQRGSQAVLPQDSTSLPS